MESYREEQLLYLGTDVEEACFVEEAWGNVVFFQLNMSMCVVYS